jgi:hypothetical protein
VLKYVLKLPVSLKTGSIRKGIFISAGATRYTNLFQGSVSTLKSWYKTLDIEYSGELLLPGIDNCNALAGHPAFLKEAFLLGQQLAN